LAVLIVRKTEGLKGTVEAPPSKAYTHRAVIAASLSDGESRIRRPLFCEDTLATIEACKMLGAKIDMDADEKALRVIGAPKPATPPDVINCRNSGSTIRFVTPICALAEGISILTGGESLRRRPMGPLLKALRSLGVQCYSARRDGYPPVIVFGGGIRGGDTSIRGDVSSQFISGLIFATPKAERETRITLTSPLESKPYVEMTINIVRRHGVEVSVQEDYRHLMVPPKQEYKPSDHMIEGDYSSASFILAAAAITDSKVRVENLPAETLQGDRLIVDILRRMNVRVNVGENYVEVMGVKGALEAITVDLRDNPDLVPVCAALAASARGRTVIKGVRRLRFKESDRLVSISSEMAKLGAKVKVEDDRLEVVGGELHGAEIDPRNDHRIAMACAVAALRAEGETRILGIECINKSYPNFVRDIQFLGGDLSEQQLHR